MSLRCSSSISAWPILLSSQTGLAFTLLILKKQTSIETSFKWPLKTCTRMSCIFQFSAMERKHSREEQKPLHYSRWACRWTILWFQTKRTLCTISTFNVWRRSSWLYLSKFSPWLTFWKLWPSTFARSRRKRWRTMSQSCSSHRFSITHTF